MIQQKLPQHSSTCKDDLMIDCASGTVQSSACPPLQRLLSRGTRLTVALLTAAMMAACGGGGGGGTDATVVSVVPAAPVASVPTASRVGISGTAQVGQVLTGVYTYADVNGDAEGVSTFRWLRGGSAIAGATGTTYTITTADQGNALAFEVTPVSTVAPERGLPVSSTPTAPIPTVVVPVPPAAPSASSVAISGNAQVGGLLTGMYVYADANSDAEGASTFRWLRNGVAIVGATAVTYTPVAADQRAFLTFEVTPVASVAPFVGTPVVSAATAAIAGPGPATAPTANPVAILGIPQVGQTLTGSYVYADVNNDLEGVSAFRWLSAGAPIPGATALTYQLAVADQGKTITFEVTPVSTVAPLVGAPTLSSPTAAIVAAPKSVAMKLLVISAVGTAPSYLATLSILDQIGVPYDKIVLKGPNPTALQMVAGTLSDSANSGKYQGIIVETGDLAYEASAGFFPSAMTAAQWAMLRQYQSDFGVRSATMYTRPAATVDVNNAPLDLTYGLTPGTARSTNDFTAPPDAPVSASFTATGAGFFSYLNTANPVIIKNAFTYLSTPNAGPQTVPLLTATENGISYAIVSTFSGAGWENIAISADGNPELNHTLLLGYGIVNWVTKGLFLGERKIYMSAQPDDVFIPDDLWNPATNTTPFTEAFRWRNDAIDYTSLVDWQTALRSNSQTAAFRLEIPFNGVGYNTTDTSNLNPGPTPGSYLPDTLSAAVRANPNAFRWINHTWDHSSLNPADPSDPDFVTPTVASISNQLNWNHEVATGTRSGVVPGTNASTADPKVTFANYTRNAMVQPDISGLENPVFWQAAQNFGMKYILMDTSRAYTGFNPPRPTVGPISPNTGYTSSLDTSPANNRILIIPRYPTNLFYNVSTPAEWVSEYNFIYSSQLGISNYEAILGRESEVLVRYMLKYNVNSWMFHAANLRDYDGAGPNKKSLLSDLLDVVVAKFRAMYSLPVLSPSQSEIGAIMEARMAYNAAIAAGVTGRIVTDPLNPRKIEITNPTGAPVNLPVTGINVNGTQYGGQSISVVPVGAGAPTSYAAP